jgi:hypothetical protein
MNLGKMCLELVRRLQGVYPGYGKIGGGGHRKAAELLADDPVPMYGVMHELLQLTEEMMGLSKALETGAADPEQVKKSKELGILD